MMVEEIALTLVETRDQWLNVLNGNPPGEASTKPPPPTPSSHMDSLNKERPPIVVGSPPPPSSAESEPKRLSTEKAEPPSASLLASHPQEPPVGIPVRESQEQNISTVELATPPTRDAELVQYEQARPPGEVTAVVMCSRCDKQLSANKTVSGLH